MERIRRGDTTTRPHLPAQLLCVNECTINGCVEPTWVTIQPAPHKSLDLCRWCYLRLFCKHCDPFPRPPLHPELATWAEGMYLLAAHWKGHP